MDDNINSDEKNYINDVFALMDEDSFDDFLEQVNVQNSFVNNLLPDHIIVDIDGNYIEINGDPDRFVHLLSDDNLALVFSKFISFFRNGVDLIITRPTRAPNDVEAREFVCIRQTVIQSALHDIAPLHRITEVEYGLILDLVSGKSLNQSAEIDGVSIHTRRSQIKSISNKLNVNSQAEMVRNVVTATLSLIFTADTDWGDKVQPMPDLNSFLNRFFPHKFRVHNVSVSSGHNIRVLDFGAIDGDVYFWLHILILPFGPNFSPEWFEKNNIRVIIPLRDGYLETWDEPQTVEEFLNRSVATIGDFANLLGVEKFSILAGIQSSAFALEYARKNSHKISKLIFANTLVLNSKSNGMVKSFFNGVSKLATSNAFVRNKIHNYMEKKLENRETALRFMKRTISQQGPDSMLYDAMMSHKNFHKFCVETIKMSRHAIQMDYTLLNQNFWQNLDQITCPVLFIQGQHVEDFAEENLKKLSGSFPNADYVVVRNRGQVIFGENPEVYFSFATNYKSSPGALNKVIDFPPIRIGDVEFK